MIALLKLSDQLMLEAAQVQGSEWTAVAVAAAVSARAMTAFQGIEIGVIFVEDSPRMNAGDSEDPHEPSLLSQRRLTGLTKQPQ